MYLSGRERKILELLIDSSNGSVTVDELIKVLNVSKRTIYREIASLEVTLTPFDVRIKKQRGKGYQLVGSKEELKKLETFASDISPTVLEMEQRQHALALELLLSEKEIWLDDLVDKFGVSVGTIQNDLLAIDQMMEEQGLSLRRTKTIGLYVQGLEREKRQLASTLIYRNSNEYDFYQFVLHVLQGQTAFSSDPFLSRISTDSTRAVGRAIMVEYRDRFLEVTDNQLMKVMLVLALSLDRINHQHYVEVQENDMTASLDSLRLSYEVLAFIEEQGYQRITIQERNYFADQLESMNFNNPQTIFLEDFDTELSYKVKELIAVTSDVAGIAFNHDETLYRDLLAHISAALKRPLTWSQTLTNPLLSHILSEYADLYTVISNSFKNVFPSVELSEEEMAYIVIHFASSVERNPTSHQLHALVLCSSGVGTAKILESRIKKYVPEIQTTEVHKISEMNRIDYSKFDLILSTIFLPGFRYPYRWISPMLLDEEIEELRRELKREIPSARKKNPVKEQLLSDEDFENAYELMKTAKFILDHFEVLPVNSEATVRETIKQILSLVPDTITTNRDRVAIEVIRRFESSPIGIPNSSMGLFHSSNEAVDRPYFSIFELDRPFEIMGMDRKPMKLKRVLLLLGPDPLPKESQQLLGRISSSIIESDVNMERFSKGTKQQVHQLLSNLFLKESKL